MDIFCNKSYQEHPHTWRIFLIILINLMVIMIIDVPPIWQFWRTLNFFREKLKTRRPFLFEIFRVKFRIYILELRLATLSSF